jgi:hypothetical protein
VKRVSVALIVMCIAASACGSDSPSSPSSSALSGTMTAMQAGRPYSSQVSFDLQQSGTSLSATWREVSGGNTVSPMSGTLGGSLTGTTFRGTLGVTQLAGGGGTCRFQGTADGTVSGNSLTLNLRGFDIQQTCSPALDNIVISLRR